MRIFAVEDYWVPGSGIVIKALNEMEARNFGLFYWGPNRNREKFRVKELSLEDIVIYEWEGD